MLKEGDNDWDSPRILRRPSGDIARRGGPGYRPHVRTGAVRPGGPEGRPSDQVARPRVRHSDRLPLASSAGPDFVRVKSEANRDVLTDGKGFAMNLGESAFLGQV
jgi:hypothetical protein